ncbi:hypothetical protein BU26DRAFT_124337 [Trematosphaeria pertusa]|uniref:Uncharacterized protein n=1 Tax=Trematosphaeria pertusa TaxID=390896 RepID=A0A6A6HYP2_9PLEO|nr:uncharacterized protein BU26DRAFT_124337 [Trematosphaeria pertusa]KAF2243009.1 hypothetical protein BU26DRAFT_124337 [Trematosphaeria pertusa]
MLHFVPRRCEGAWFDVSSPNETSPAHERFETSTIYYKPVPHNRTYQQLFRLMNRSMHLHSGFPCASIIRPLLNPLYYDNSSPILFLPRHLGHSRLDSVSFRPVVEIANNCRPPGRETRCASLPEPDPMKQHKHDLPSSSLHLDHSCRRPTPL